MSARSEGIAYRIWAYAQPLGWNCTNAQIADGIGESVHVVANVCAMKDWTRRLRVEIAGRIFDGKMSHMRSRAGGEVRDQMLDLWLENRRGGEEE